MFNMTNFFDEQIIVVLALQSVAVGFTAFLIPKLRVTGISGPILTVIALAFANRMIWDQELFSFLPTTFSLHAATVVACNGVLFWVLVKLLPGIEIDGILPALVAPIVLTITNGLVVHYGKQVDWSAVLHEAYVATTDVRDSLKSDTE